MTLWTMAGTVFILACIAAGAMLTLAGREYGRAVAEYRKAAESHRKSGANYQASIEHLSEVKRRWPLGTKSLSDRSES